MSGLRPRSKASFRLTEFPELPPILESKRPHANPAAGRGWLTTGCTGGHDYIFHRIACPTQRPWRKSFTLILAQVLRHGVRLTIRR